MGKNAKVTKCHQRRFERRKDLACYHQLVHYHVRRESRQENIRLDAYGRIDSYGRIDFYRRRRLRIVTI